MEYSRAPAKTRRQSCSCVKLNIIFFNCIVIFFAKCRNLNNVIFDAILYSDGGITL